MMMMGESGGRGGGGAAARAAEGARSSGLLRRAVAVSDDDQAAEERGLMAANDVDGGKHSEEEVAERKEEEVVIFGGGGGGGGGGGEEEEEEEAGKQAQIARCRWIVGMAMVFVVASVWVAASFLVQYVEDRGIKALMLTYICNSLFLILIPVVEAGKLLAAWGYDSRWLRETLERLAAAVVRAKRANEGRLRARFFLYSELKQQAEREAPTAAEAAASPRLSSSARPPGNAAASSAGSSSASIVSRSAHVAQAFAMIASQRDTGRGGGGGGGGGGSKTEEEAGEGYPAAALILPSARASSPFSSAGPTTSPASPADSAGRGRVGLTATSSSDSTLHSNNWLSEATPRGTRQGIDPDRLGSDGLLSADVERGGGGGGGGGGDDSHHEGDHHSRGLLIEDGQIPASDYYGAVGAEGFVKGYRHAGQSDTLQSDRQEWEAEEPVHVEEIVPLSRMETAIHGLVICPFWFLAQLTFNLSLKYTTVTANTILSTTSSLFTFVLSVMFLNEAFTWHKVACVFLCMVGTVVVSLSDTDSSGSGSGTTSPPSPSKRTSGVDGFHVGFHLIGDGLTVLSSVLYAIYTTLLKLLLPDEASTPPPPPPPKEKGKPSSLSSSSSSHGDGNNKEKEKDIEINDDKVLLLNSKKKRSVNVMEVFGYIGLFNFLLFGPVVLTVHLLDDRMSITWMQFLMVCGKGIFDNVLSDVVWAKAVMLTTTTAATVGLSIQIPFATAVDMLFKSVVPGVGTMIGTTLILVGFFGIYLPELCAGG